ncbi:MAG: hypothetical protein ACLVJ8_16560 [Ruthenibacterium lactatiformans]
MPRRPRGCAHRRRAGRRARAGPAGEVYRGGQAVRPADRAFKAQAQGLGPISEVDLTNTLELSFLYQDRIRIVLGTTNDLDYKIKWAWEMVTPGQTSDSLGEEERGTLDVSSRGEDGLGRARWRAGVL